MPKANTQLGRMTQGARPSRVTRPRPVGRVTTLTPEVRKKIVDAVRAGNRIAAAARYAGVGETTINDWIARGRGEGYQGRRSGREYVELVNDLDEAMGSAEVAAVLHWRSAMPKDWHAAEKWLKVTHPEHWDPDRDRNGAGNAYAGVQVNISGLNAPNGANSASNAPNRLDNPLMSLIDANPRVLDAVKPLFDLVDAEYAETAPNDATNAQMTPIAPISGQIDQNGVIEGSYTPIEPENAPNDANDPF